MSDSFLIMYDAIPENVGSIPGKAEAVAGYVDGNFKSFPLLVKRFFPHAHCVSINVFLGNLAAFADVESGNPINTPDKVRADFHFKKAHGVWRPGYYADHDHMVNIVLPGLVGIARSEYRLWLADWDGVRVVPNGFDAKQYANPKLTRHPFDTSIVDIERFFPRTVKPAPKPAPKPKPKPKPIHPKVTAAGIGGALTTALVAFLNSHGVHVTHLTPPESAAIATAAAALAGYFKSSGGNK